MIDLQNDYESLISTSNQVETLQKYKINPQFELFLEDSKTKKVSSPQIKNSFIILKNSVPLSGFYMLNIYHHINI